MEKATLGAGCFWGVESTFRQVEGVQDATVGYSGGHLKNPTYKDVCRGDTGHAEVLQIVFNPETLSYQKLLEVFFKIHDPTTRNRQGPDVGTQYRSVIFFHSPEQKSSAEQMIADLDAEKTFDQGIVTEISPAVEFYPAEDYHQRYFEKRGQIGHCKL